ncbi:ABC transporter ATP-binding protein [candidate division WOR-3 bacterium]|nr:ABC transporter ATP-binding protein [candidate division WOR-3 bacterium]
MIKIQKVSKYFSGKEILSDISLDIKKRDFVAIIGPNGAGKTTLLKTINGLILPDTGKVEVLDLDPYKNGLAVRKKIGFIFQNEFIAKNVPLSVKDVVCVGRVGVKGLFKNLTAEDFASVEKAMGEVGIMNLEDRPAGFLSGGEQRKVSIARELARDIEILLLDEILMNLDPASQMEINSLISGIYKKHKLTIVFVTHLLRYLPEEITRVVALKDGRVFSDFSPRDFNSKVLSRLYDVNEESLMKYVGNFKL